MTPSDARLLTGDELDAYCTEQRSADRRVALTNGCFDVLHAGHVELLRQAATLADVLIVGVNADAAVRHLKGAGRPVLPVHDRVQIIAAVRWVDAVVAFDDHTADVLIERVHPDIYVKGGDYDVGAAGSPLPEQATLDRLQISARFVPLLPGRSSSDLLARISSQR